MLDQEQDDQEPLPQGWEERQDANGRTFYVDHTSRVTQWERPTTQSEVNVRQRSAQRSADTRRQMAQTLARRNPGMTTGEVCVGVWVCVWVWVWVWVRVCVLTLLFSAPAVHTRPVWFSKVPLHQRFKPLTEFSAQFFPKLNTSSTGQSDTVYYYVYTANNIFSQENSQLHVVIQGYRYHKGQSPVTAMYLVLAVCM